MQSLFQGDFLLQVSGITPGRGAAILLSIIGLTSVVLGWRGLARSTRRQAAGRRTARIALIVGIIGTVVSTFHLVAYKGDFGTGSGKAGAIVAMLLGLVGTTLGGLALSRMRRMGRESRVE